MKKTPASLPAKPESHLQKIARERREARAATGAAPAPVMPRTKLKRRKVREVIVEVEKKPLMLKLCDLAFHPHLKRVGLLPALIEREEKLGTKAGKSRDNHKGHAEELSQEFEALKLSILDHGLREAVKVCKDGKGNWQVVDGRHRFQAVQHIVAANSLLNPNHTHNSTWLANADKLEKDGIPCIEIQPSEVTAVILDAVKRRHFSKGALAYLAVLMNPSIATEERRGGNRSKTAEIAVLTLPARIADFAKHTGVSERTMESAIRLYKYFAEREDARLVFEPAIWIGESLDRILGGVASYLLSGAAEDQETDDQRVRRIAMERATHAVDRFNKLDVALRNWETLLPEGRASVIERAVLVLTEAPTDLQNAIYEAIAHKSCAAFA